MRIYDRKPDLFLGVGTFVGVCRLEAAWDGFPGASQATFPADDVEQYGILIAT